MKYKIKKRREGGWERRDERIQGEENEVLDFAATCKNSCGHQCLQTSGGSTHGPTSPVGWLGLRVGGRLVLFYIYQINQANSP